MRSERCYATKVFFSLSLGRSKVSFEKAAKNECMYNVYKCTRVCISSPFINLDSMVWSGVLYD